MDRGKKLLDIINAIRRNKGDSPINALAPSTNLRRELDFDSFDMAELTVKIEVEFGIDIFENGVVETYSEILDKLK